MEYFFRVVDMWVEMSSWADAEETLRRHCYYQYKRGSRRASRAFFFSYWAPPSEARR